VLDFLGFTVNGLVSGSFYALLALGLAIIFGMLGVVNFAHGAFYMLGAFAAYFVVTDLGLPFWWAVVLVPAAFGLVGVALERLAVRRLARVDPLYNFLFTFGLALIIQDAVKAKYTVNSITVAVPQLLDGDMRLGGFRFPAYRVFVFVFAMAACLGVWWLLSRTRVGMIVRAATERPELTEAFGIDVSRWVTPVFGFGIGLAALSGVLAAPMRAVGPMMGADLIIVVFAVVVIGGLGSILGSVVAGFAVGLIQAWGEATAPPLLSQILVFLVMAAVLLWRPFGLFGREEQRA
jgi:branched-chain amino acid transport system permease protein